MWWQKKDYRYYFNKGFIDAVFSPKENLSALKREYENLKPKAEKYWKLRAKAEGFLAGLEKRNRSRLDLLEKMKDQSREEKDLER